MYITSLFVAAILLCMVLRLGAPRVEWLMYSGGPKLWKSEAEISPEPPFPAC